MGGILIDWGALEAAFENHAPDVRTYLERSTGELFVITPSTPSSDPVAEKIRADLDGFVRIEPVPSREQYQMMEAFIETVINETLKTQLQDSIVGKGAFRRFKDTVGRYSEERKRWFAFRDVLLHRYILRWLQDNEIELQELPDWSTTLPEPAPHTTEPAPSGAALPAAAGADERQELEALWVYLQTWARAHGEEFRHFFGPAAFERLAEDMVREFSFFRRR